MGAADKGTSGWAAWVVTGVVVCLVASCASQAPVGSTATSVSAPGPTATSEGYELVILHTCHTEGVVESTAASGG